MSITQALATSFKKEALLGKHNFGVGVVRGSNAADVFKIALYTSTASLGAGTTAYTATNEVSAAGYTAGGKDLVISTPPDSSGTTAFLSFDTASWPASSITARGALIYNSSQGNAAVAVLDFGGDRVSTNGVFSVIFPAADAANAIIRIG